MRFGICPKCKEFCQLTRHHIRPKRFYGKNTDEILWICRTCHDNIELLIPREEKKDDNFYYQVVEIFLGE